MSRAVGAVREPLLRPSLGRKCDFRQSTGVARTCRRTLSACVRPVGVHPRMGEYMATKGVAAYAPSNFHQFSRAEGPIGTDLPRSDWFALYPSEGFEKDVKIVGTNSITSLESVKASINELKTNSKRTQICAKNSAIGTQNAGWRVRAGVFCRRVCAPLERPREWAHTSRQKASRRIRHPVFISFRGPKAHGD